MPEIRRALGSYDLLEVVGHGGMATVYHGRRRESGQIVAVKVMDPAAASNPVLVRRFEQEYAAGRRLHHPNLVEVWDYGVEDGRPYLVMEYIEGETLGRRIRKQGPLPEAEAVRVITQVAEALHAAHQLGMIHRDVKTDNVLLTKDGRAKLSDLGLIKDLHNGQPLTQTRTCLGTIAFIAPEQFEDAKRADARCDVYGLGATLYHALTGAMPFQGRRNLQILRQKIANDFLPPRQRVPSVSDHVNDAVCRALDAAPQRRQASCREFTASLLRAAPPVAAPAPRPADPVIAGVSPDAGGPSVDGADRRRARRFPSDLGAACRAVMAGRQTWNATIQDISCTGLRMWAERRFEPGALLVVEVATEPVGATLYAKVVWVRPSGPQKWGLGCELQQELQPAELETLLGDKAKTVVIYHD